MKQVTQKKEILIDILKAPQQKYVLTAKAPLSQKPEIIKKTNEEFTKENNLICSTMGVWMSEKKYLKVESQKKKMQDQMYKGILTDLMLQRIPELSKEDLDSASVEELLFTYKAVKLEGTSVPTLEQLAERDHPIIKNCLEHPKEFVICDMEESVGKGLFLSKNNKPIKAGEVIAIYGGEYREQVDEKSEYSVTLSNNSLATEIEGTGYRSLASFAQDFPTDEEVDKYYIMPKGVREKISTANAELSTGIYDKVYPISFLKATKDIFPEKPIGYSYNSISWWNKRGRDEQRCFFDNKTQEIIDKKTYAISYVFAKGIIASYKDIGLTIKRLEQNPDAKGSIKKINSAFQKAVVPESLNTISLEGAQVRFFHQAKLVLMQHYYKHFLEHDDSKNELSLRKANYMKLLYTATENFTDTQGVEAYKKINELVQQNKEFYSEHLKDFIQEISKAAKSYNSAKQLWEGKLTIKTELDGPSKLKK
jgi:hypothetical protein